MRKARVTVAACATLLGASSRVRRTRWLSLILAAAAALAPGTASAITATLAADGYTVAGAAAKTGAKTTLKVAEAGSTTAFVRFDLSALPDAVGAAQIAKATLRLYVQK